MGRLRLLTAGESHGECLTVILEGMPAGLKIDEDYLQQEMARRQKGYGRGGRMKIECDKAKITAGVRFGETLGSPLSITVQNRDWQNWTEKMAVFGPQQQEQVYAARPGHADLAGSLKYGRQDVRDVLERASARETAARVAAGAVCKELLAVFGIEIFSYVTNIGGVKVQKNYQTKEELGCLDEDVFCPEIQTAAEMKRRIDEARKAGYSLGGCFKVMAAGLPAGLGSYSEWDRRLDTKIAAAMMSVPAVKGVEIGDGFALADMKGNEAQDEIFWQDGAYQRKTNHAGGIEGGISNGETLVVQLAMKPIPTQMVPLRTVNIRTKEQVAAVKERSDVCAVPAAAVAAEAMLAYVLADEFLYFCGGDNMTVLKRNYAALKTDK